MGPGNDVDGVKLDYSDTIDHPAQMPDIDLSGRSLVCKTLGSQGNSTSLSESQLAHGGERVNPAGRNLSLASLHR